MLPLEHPDRIQISFDEHLSRVKHSCRFGVNQFEGVSLEG